MPLAPLQDLAKDGLVNLVGVNDIYIRGKQLGKSEEDARTLGMGIGASLVDLASVSPSRFLMRTECSITSRSK